MPAQYHRPDLISSRYSLAHKIGINQDLTESVRVSFVLSLHDIEGTLVQQNKIHSKPSKRLVKVTVVCKTGVSSG